MGGRIGVLCPEVSGHLHPMLALCKVLQQRGHQITFVGPADGADRVRQAGVDYRVVGEKLLPLGSLEQRLRKLAMMTGWAASRYTMQIYAEWTDVLLRDATDTLESLGCDRLLVDQTIFAGQTIATRLQIPMVNLCGALLINVEDHVPLFTLGWNYRRDLLGRARNRLAYQLMRRMIEPVMSRINTYRRQHGLAAHRDVHETFSTLAQLVPIPPEFDFPRERLPEHVHYVGPLASPHGRLASDFDFAWLDGRPLIYASFGTLQTGLREIFARISQACAQLPVQLVITLGGGDVQLGPAADNTRVVTYAPQLELLKRASLTVTHAGLNTVMESLGQGVPLVALPVANDQPGVSARIVYHGLGDRLSLRSASVARLREMIHRVGTQPSYRQQAQRLRLATERTGGISWAADIAEAAWRSGRPVFRGTELSVRRAERTAAGGVYSDFVG